MDRNEKSEVVSALHASLKQMGVVVVTRNLGMSVAQSTQLRQKMRDAGVHAFLVGEAFMRADDPGMALASLFGG